ncbi:large ribosomal subunit protein mL44 [Ciona intestinalis]
MWSISLSAILKRGNVGSLMKQRVHPRNYSSVPGNPAIKPVNPSAVMPPRWMKHYYLALERKEEIEGPDPPLPRSTKPNWNITAELTAFKNRLDIEVPNELLVSALTEPLFNQPSTEDTGYSKLLEDGSMFVEEFVSHYVKQAFPFLTSEGRSSICDFLLLDANIAYLALNLGYNDLLQLTGLRSSEKVLAESLVASIEAINLSEGPVAAAKFILNFLVPQLVGKDIIDDIWKPSNPMALLTESFKMSGKPAPEARLIQQCGVNTVTPIYYVGLFSGKDLIAKSGAESVVLAETDAAKLALKHIYHVHTLSKSPPMGNLLNQDFLNKLFYPLIDNKTALSS